MKYKATDEEKREIMKYTDEEKREIIELYHVRVNKRMTKQFRFLALLLVMAVSLSIYYRLNPSDELRAYKAQKEQLKQSNK